MYLKEYKLKDPLPNATLAEAAAWLTEATGTTFTEREMLFLAFRATLDALKEWHDDESVGTARPRTFLHAALSDETEFVWRKSLHALQNDRSDSEGTPLSTSWTPDDWPKWHKARWTLIPLTYDDGHDLITRGRITRNIGTDEFGDGEIDLQIAPGETVPPVTPSMLRFTYHDQWSLRDYCIKRQDMLAAAVQTDRTPKTLVDVSADASIGSPKAKAAAAMLVKSPKHRRQESTILKWLSEKGYDPKNLPPQELGKAWIPSKAWADLKKQPDLFATRNVLDKAWWRLREFGDIAVKTDPHQN